MQGFTGSAIPTDAAAANGRTRNPFWVPPRQAQMAYERSLASRLQRAIPAEAVWHLQSKQHPPVLNVHKVFDEQGLKIIYDDEGRPKFQAKFANCCKSICCMLFLSSMVVTICGPNRSEHGELVVSPWQEYLSPALKVAIAVPLVSLIFCLYRIGNEYNSKLIIDVGARAIFHQKGQLPPEMKCTFEEFVGIQLIGDQHHLHSLNPARPRLQHTVGEPGPLHTVQKVHADACQGSCECGHRGKNTLCCTSKHCTSSYYPDLQESFHADMCLLGFPCHQSFQDTNWAGTEIIQWSSDDGFYVVFTYETSA